jgi:hypothetical protein
MEAFIAPFMVILFFNALSFLAGDDHYLIDIISILLSLILLPIFILAFLIQGRKYDKQSCRK